MDERRLRESLNFSWLIRDSVAGMAYPCTEDELALLKQVGVGALLTLTEDVPLPERLPDLGFRVAHVPIADFAAPTVDQIGKAIEAIRSYRTAGTPVAVHCFAGLGRTGTILACYLVYLGSSAESAIESIRELRPGSIESAEQEASVYAYERQLRQ